MRYVVYGAGAVGGAIAARLRLSGLDVVAIARGQHLRTLQRDGLRFATPEGQTVVELPTVASPADADLRSDDVVLLTVKGQDTDAALGALARAAPRGIAVVCAQNGVDNERQALRRFAPVYGMLVYLPVQHLEPGMVEAFSAPLHGVLDVGLVPNGSDPTAERLANDLKSAGFDSRTVEDVMAWKRAKLIRNLGNALDAVLGDAADAAEDLERRAIREAEDCFAAAGLPVIPEARALERMRAMSQPVASVGRGRGGSSSWQSLARGTGSIEADWLNGEIVLLGRMHGIPTPVNAALQRVANEAAARGAEPGSYTRAAIDALV